MGVLFCEGGEFSRKKERLWSLLIYCLSKVNDLVVNKALGKLLEETEKAWLLEGQRQREHHRNRKHVAPLLADIE